MALKEKFFNQQSVYLFFLFGLDISVLILLRDMSWHCLQDAKTIECSMFYEIVRKSKEGVVCLFCKFFLNQVNLWLLFHPILLLAG